MMRIKTIIAAAAIAVTSTAVSADMKPAVIYDMGGKFDKSFNEGVYNGVKKFTDETGIEVMEFEVTNETQREQAMRRMAERGATVVLGVGFAQADAISKVAAEFPDTKFSIIDVSWLDAPNLRQYAFKEHEGSYIVGVAAAKASKTGKVGFVGGMDIGLIRRFACGYVGGVKSVNASAEVYQNMTGTTPAAWNDPAKGAELTQSQIDRGADVVYHAAGGTGAGTDPASGFGGNTTEGGNDGNAGGNAAEEEKEYIANKYSFTVQFMWEPNEVSERYRLKAEADEAARLEREKQAEEAARLNGDQNGSPDSPPIDGPDGPPIDGPDGPPAGI